MLSLAQLVPVFGGLARAVLQIVARGKGAAEYVRGLPTLVKFGLVQAGFAEGVDILTPEVDLISLSDLPIFPQNADEQAVASEINEWIAQQGGGALATTGVQGIQTMGAGGVVVVGRWVANGVPFVKLLDGRHGAWSAKKGAWKFWRPKKPIVIYSSGSSSLNTLLRADTAIDNQIKRLRKVINRRYPSRRPRTKYDVVETGSGSVTVVGKR